ncbi:outer membrane protein assembly factor BamE [Ramlibacter sp. MAHUQ-53]|uniref:outer membrane protein assembly factor BamE n=1 Tax=unclassified Ramlibacter TaxID=2617605 RepID=UPI00362C276F
MPAIPLRSSRLALVLAACALAAGCGSLDGASARVAGAVTPYKMPIVQGNFVSREQVAVLKPGMSRQQVREILGTPLLASVFHADRWDYVFTLRRQGVPPQAYRLTVQFKGDALERFEGDTMPTEAEFVALLDVARRNRPVPPLEATEAQLKRFPAPAPAAPEAPLPPAAASYPPLEPPSR